MSDAWIIDRDHLDERRDAEHGPNHGAHAPTGDVGLTGPSTAPLWMTTELSHSDVDTGVASRLTDDERAVVYTFHLYDDGALCCTGRMLTDEGPSKDACYAPLRDDGGSGADCVASTYRGHPEMDRS